MNIETLCNKINLPDSVTQQVLEADVQLDEALLAPAFTLLTQRETGLEGYGTLSAALGDDPMGIKMLACQLRCACGRYATYQHLGIPDDIYFATMSCYTRFVTECLYYKGSYQFDRGWWTWRQLSLSAFRIGRLEFERRHPGEIAVHIPSGSPLPPEQVEEALTQAAAFFAKYFPEYTQAEFTCRSWLLSQELKKLLPASSNILHFMNRFTIREVDEDNQDYISWLFQRPVGVSIEDLPENTSLQRKVKEYLLAGGKIGTASGVLNKGVVDYESE